MTKLNSRNKKKQICLSNKEYISSDRDERINMAAKYKIFVTVTEYFTGICIA